MKFPRNARILRSQLDAAPAAAVFFLLVLFVMMGTLVFTPGVPFELRLPAGDSLPGNDKPSVSVAIDAAGRLYYEHQWIDEQALQAKLHEAVVRHGGEPLTLVVQADKSVTQERVTQLLLLARKAGISKAWMATLPGPLGQSRP